MARALKNHCTTPQRVQPDVEANLMSGWTGIMYFLVFLATTMVSVAMMAPRLLSEPSAKAPEPFIPPTIANLIADMTAQDKAALDRQLSESVDAWHGGFTLDLLSDRSRSELNARVLAAAQKEYLSALVKELMEEEKLARAGAASHHMDAAVEGVLTQGLAGLQIRLETAIARIEALQRDAELATLDSTMRDFISQQVDRQLAVYHADRTNKVDFALAVGGGAVLASSPSVTIKEKSWLFGEWETVARLPENMLSPDMNLGQCWAMEGSSGWALLKLSRLVHVESVSLEHISNGLTPVSQSTPKVVKFYGLEREPKPDETLPGLFLASVDYNREGARIQESVVAPSQQTFQFLNMTVESNHGASYTCIYRVRVHGK